MMVLAMFVTSMTIMTPSTMRLIIVLRYQTLTKKTLMGMVLGMLVMTLMTKPIVTVTVLTIIPITVLLLVIRIKEILMTMGSATCVTGMA